MKQRLVQRDGDGNINIKTTVDVTHAVDNAARLRDTGGTLTSDSVCIGSIDAALLFRLAQNAGVDLTDGDALGEFAEKLLQGKMFAGIDGADFSKFRVYQGEV